MPPLLLARGPARRKFLGRADILTSLAGQAVRHFVKVLRVKYFR